jgi:hypothetical protein
MSLFDATGCLTAEGLAAVAGSVPGKVAPEAARHLATCVRCQQRALSGGVDRPVRPASRPPVPSVKRALLLLGLVLVAVLFFFWTLHRLVG